MTEFNLGRAAWITAGAAVLMTAAVVYLQFRKDIREDYRRLENAPQQVVETDCGAVQLASYGEGQPVVVLHGIFGGYDQGLVMAEGQIGKDFRSLVPSRFGYLGSPFPADASPEKQADLLACLLDSQGIERAAVLGTSAGGTAAVQFALRHPDRCSGLILVSSNAPGETVGLPPEPAAKMMFRSDFLFWVLTRGFRGTMYSIMGVPGDFELSPAQREEMDRVMQTVLPVKPRAQGALFDMYISNPAINEYDLSKINVPTLVIHAQDDPLADYENARALVESIPDARLVDFERGGHPLLGHGAEIRSAIAAFLEGTPTAGK